jgi:hypothetical protein
LATKPAPHSLKPALAAIRSHPSIPVVGVKAPTWHRAMGVVRTCWNCEARWRGRWFPGSPGCACASRATSTISPKNPRGAARARRGCGVGGSRCGIPFKHPWQPLRRSLVRFRGGPFARGYPQKTHPRPSARALKGGSEMDPPFYPAGLCGSVCNPHK